MITITVFTPTYNRARLLPRLYRSLCAQRDKNFEWLIVDDGSTDATEKTIKALSQAAFPIRYIRKENGGKHTAINLGAKEARGELFFIVDSDDCLPPGATATIAAEYSAIKGNPAFAGVCGYMAHSDGDIIGRPLINANASSICLRYHYKVKGDMAEVFKTEVLRAYPFPEIAGERFCPEALVWNRIAATYKLKIFSKVVCIRDYLPGGLSANIVRIRMSSPLGSMATYAEITRTHDIPFPARVKAAINYWRFRLCRKKRGGNAALPQISPVWLWTFPISWAMHLYDIVSTTTPKPTSPKR